MNPDAVVFVNADSDPRSCSLWRAGGFLNLNFVMSQWHFSYLKIGDFFTGKYFQL
jgi:hypothetical protein